VIVCSKNSFILNLCQMFGAMYLNFGAIYLNFGAKVVKFVFKFTGVVDWSIAF